MADRTFADCVFTQTLNFQVTIFSQQTFVIILFYQTDVSLGEHSDYKKKFSIKDFFSKYDQIHSFMRLWSHLMKKSSLEK